jgi:hypothetical protein
MLSAYRSDRRVVQNTKLRNVDGAVEQKQEKGMKLGGAKGI